MADTLVIVESPSKAKTIEKYLGTKYKVLASNGHVRDLPKSQLGVDIENDFMPKYITLRGRGEVLDRIRKEAKAAKHVVLATDPDREGEAISWHLSKMLGIDEATPCRVVFNEITKGVIQKAIKQPRTIDMSLVDSQQARRVLDRLVGYKLSPWLWAKVRKGLSAGRVQSVTAKLICDREREILDFVPREYWTVTIKLHHGRKSFEAKFHGLNGKKFELNNKEDADRIVALSSGAEYVVSDIKVGKRTRHAPPPYTTSSMLQDASNRAGMPSKRTMLCAQQLYEGVEVLNRGSIGLITYMRTDSVRISGEAQSSAAEYIKERFGAEYVPQKPNIYRGRNNAQDAHEAIRPTDVSLTPDMLKPYLDAGQFKLYKLIYERFLASQMSEALFETTTASIDAIGSDVCSYRASGTVKLFDGFTAVYSVGAEGDDPDKKGMTLPKLEIGDKPKFEGITPKQNFTEPPARYTEASLVKTLEELGIGRPSTYSPTISTIVDRGYVVREKKQLVPTELGFIVTKLMEDNFKDIVDVKFTAEMESKLDSVEDGDIRWQTVIEDFYSPFKEELDKAFAETEKVVIKEEVSDIPCDKCGAMMVYKHGRFGKFLACPNFPECKNTKTITEKIGVKCPKCGADIVKRHGKKKNFYGCERYPECDYVSWDMPTNEVCPKCGQRLVRKMGPKGYYTTCPNKECKFVLRNERNKQDAE